MCEGAFCSGIVGRFRAVSPGRGVYSEVRKPLFLRAEASSQRSDVNNCYHTIEHRSDARGKGGYVQGVYGRIPLPRVVGGGAYTGWIPPFLHTQGGI